MDDAEKLIRERIKTKGNISVPEFMEIALYDKNFGYYTNGTPIGKDGDFITAPEVSHLFGDMIAVWILQKWESLNKRDFVLVELGSGKGTLIRDILHVTRNIKKFHDAMEVNIVECSEKLIGVQEDILSKFIEKISWKKKVTDIKTNKPIIFIANEFFDALPVKIFLFQDNKWKEKLISVNSQNELEFIHEETRFSRIIKDKNSFEGKILEISTKSNRVMKYIAHCIKNNSGGALIIDYGHIESSYKDSLQSVKNHKYSNVLKNIGKSDITYHVNFKNASEIFFNIIKKYPKIQTQGEFLYSMGIEERINSIKNPENYIKLITDLKRLTCKSEMGDIFKVMDL